MPARTFLPSQGHKNNDNIATAFSWHLARCTHRYDFTWKHPHNMWWRSRGDSNKNGAPEGSSTCQVTDLVFGEDRVKPRSSDFQWVPLPPDLSPHFTQEELWGVPLRLTMGQGQGFGNGCCNPMLGSRGRPRSRAMEVVTFLKNCILKVRYFGS